VNVPKIPALVKITCPWCHGEMAMCDDGRVIKSLPNTSRLAKLEKVLEAAERLGLYRELRHGASAIIGKPCDCPGCEMDNALDACRGLA